MSIETPKSSEIKRLTAPLRFKDSKAYDSKGELIKCCETLSDIRFTVEPRPNLLNENEVLQYAPQSKAASALRLKRGAGNYQDVLLIHESLPWVLGFIYTVLICITVPISISSNIPAMFILLVLYILPLLYMYYIFNLKNYTKYTVKEVKESEKPKTVETPEVKEESPAIESLRKYEKEVNNLKVLFDVKEEVVRGLIEKRFEPPQITYDKFISVIDTCHKLFYSQSDAALNIINLAAEDTPRIQEEIQSKIEAMKKIINQIEDLTNELVINISSSEESSQEVDNLLDNMENLIGSVKDY